MHAVCMQRTPVLVPIRLLAPTIHTHPTPTAPWGPRSRAACCGCSWRGWRSAACLASPPHCWPRGPRPQSSPCACCRPASPAGVAVGMCGGQHGEQQLERRRPATPAIAAAAEPPRRLLPAQRSSAQQVAARLQQARELGVPVRHVPAPAIHLRGGGGGGGGGGGRGQAQQQAARGRQLSAREGCSGACNRPTTRQALRRTAGRPSHRSTHQRGDDVAQRRQGQVDLCGLA